MPSDGPGSSGTQSWEKRRLYGLVVASDFPFATPLEEGAGAVDLTFTCVDTSPVSEEWTHTRSLFASPHRNEAGESLILLHRLASCEVVRFTGVGDYYLWPDRIVCHLTNPQRAHLVEVHLVATVLAYWLEQQGVRVLHASAVANGDRAVAFLAQSRSGKTCLAATLMEHGNALLTDDLLPVGKYDGRFLGQAGYPQMRMWPDQATHFLGGYETLPQVYPQVEKRRVKVGGGGFGQFRTEACPLACFYLPERRDPEKGGTTVDILPVGRREALIELLRFSFTPRMVEAVGLQMARLQFFAELVSRAPVRRLIYPSGFEFLPQVRNAILRDLEALQQQSH